ncbi:very short patch repair endonuclease [Sphaerisporangium sp. B11E5]|uniref:very short patch repair endonuclease n=1 Tax=Sphaerisporangium sp. B11E5 TaxID=3153563 RepID=UPI00325ECA72
MGNSWASSPAARKSMQANRSRDTAPELALRRALHGLGLRYRVCTRPITALPRTADVVFQASKVCVEMRGCYWHGCRAHHRLPRANREYWSAKVERIRRRDREFEDLLAKAGWLLVVVWEHEDPMAAAQQIAMVVRARRRLTAISSIVDQ